MRTSTKLSLLNYKAQFQDLSWYHKMLVAIHKKKKNIGLENERHLFWGANYSYYFNIECLKNMRSFLDIIDGIVESQHDGVYTNKDILLIQLTCSCIMAIHSKIRFNVWQLLSFSFLPRDVQEKPSGILLAHHPI